MDVGARVKWTGPEGERGGEVAAFDEQGVWALVQPLNKDNKTVSKTAKPVAVMVMDLTDPSQPDPMAPEAE